MIKFKQAYVLSLPRYDRPLLFCRFSSPSCRLMVDGSDDLDDAGVY